MGAPAAIAEAVERLTASSGYTFRVSDDVVPGTQLYLVYTEAHDLPERYTVRQGGLGFRVPRNFPDAGPEDSFFITPVTIRLVVADPVRNATVLNRASETAAFLPPSILGGGPVLVFSWHLWDKPQTPWRPRTHTLMDHYTGCLRRFDHAEHG